MWRRLLEVLDVGGFCFIKLRLYSCTLMPRGQTFLFLEKPSADLKKVSYFNYLYE